MHQGPARYPSVFVVDGPPGDCPFVPPAPRSQKTRQQGQLLLKILVVVALAGLAVEAYFLVCFRKELDRATAQAGAEAFHEQLIQDHRPRSEKPGAHLIGASFTATGNDTLQWEHRHGLAFLQEMDYKKGSLVSKESGHYYIYSKVSLENTSCPGAQQKSVVVAHSVCKRTPRYPKEIVLLTSLVPYCTVEVWRQNSFLAGMVKLEEKEEVYVKVSRTQVVRVKDGTRSYFGAFMI